jgi:hypothetical protein
LTKSDRKILKRKAYNDYYESLLITEKIIEKLRYNIIIFCLLKQKNQIVENIGHYIEDKNFNIFLEKFKKEMREDGLTNEQHFNKSLNNIAKDIYDYGDYDKEENPYEKNPILAYEKEYYAKMDSGLMTDLELEEHKKIAKDFGIDASDEVEYSKKIRKKILRNEKKKNN